MDDSKVKKIVKPYSKISKLLDRDSDNNYSLPIFDREGNALRVHGSRFMINT